MPRICSWSISYSSDPQLDQAGTTKSMYFQVFIQQENQQYGVIKEYKLTKTEKYKGQLPTFEMEVLDQTKYIFGLYVPDPDAENSDDFDNFNEFAEIKVKTEPELYKLIPMIDSYDRELTGT